VVPDQEVTLLEQVRHPLPEALGATALAAGRRRRSRPPAGSFRGLCRQLLAEAADRVQDCLGQFLENVELADLVGDVPQRQGNGLRVEG